MDVADLRPVDLFDDLSDDELAPWAVKTVEHHFPAGAIVVEPDAGAPGLLLLLEGSVRAFIPAGPGYDPSGENNAPTWIGAIASLTGGEVGVRVQALTAATVGIIAADDFIDLMLSSRAVFMRVMGVVQPVLSRQSQWELNRERLTSLGTMSAGIAHELNNPAAAAKRSAAELKEALKVLSTTMKRFIEAGVERHEAEQVVKRMHAAANRLLDGEPPSKLELADAAEELQDTLEEFGVSDAWRVAESLAQARIDRDWLQEINDLSPKALGPAVAWVSATINARQLTAELSDSTDRISALVSAVRSYTYMDRGAVVDVDVHEGLETTLTVLGHRFTNTKIDVERDYATDLPVILAYGSELNQVWTNLFDNAIDAMGDQQGTIRLRTRRDGPCVAIDVEDTGPGIPADIIDRIFDPFFTTKGVGAGTGLGLDAARRIVVDRHRGSLTVESAPGRTVFHVWLPSEAPS